VVNRHKRIFDFLTNPIKMKTMSDLNSSQLNRNKKLFLVLFVIFVYTSAINAQLRGIFPDGRNLPSMRRDISNMITIDSAKIRVWYALNAKDIKDHNTYEDLHRLEIGTHISKYDSYFLFRQDSLRMTFYRWRKENPHADSGGTTLKPLSHRDPRDHNDDTEWSEYYYSILFKDFSAGSSTVYTDTPLKVPSFHYIDDIGGQDWNLHEDTATVAGYLCQKAVCSFRGRIIEAWFTPEIPINNGPWKFGGLPGLILKLYDTDKLKVFECSAIEIFEQAYPVRTFVFKNYEETSREKYRKIVIEMYKDYKKVSGIKMTSSSSAEASAWFSPPNQPYDLLELE
jgi:GLPGLI family protein